MIELTIKYAALALAVVGSVGGDFLFFIM